MRATVPWRTRDEDGPQRSRRADKAIDALEEQINVEAARLIALRAPAASDLRTVLTVMKISGNLERCGDYAKNMAKRTSVLVQMPAVDDSAASLRRMAREVELMLKDALDSLCPARHCHWRKVCASAMPTWISMYNALFREFLTHHDGRPAHNHRLHPSCTSLPRTSSVWATM